MGLYRTQSIDTAPEVERRIIERYRAMSAAEKVSIVRALCRSAEQLAVAGARRRHPGASARELRLHAAATRLPEAVMRAAFAWPLEER